MRIYKGYIIDRYGDDFNMEDSMKKRIQTYIAINGSIGCIPDNSVLCESYEQAVESLVELFELEDDDADELRENGIIYFSGREAEMGADYAEIVKGDLMSRKEYEEARENWN